MLSVVDDAIMIRFAAVALGGVYRDRGESSQTVVVDRVQAPQNTASNVRIMVAIPDRKI